MATARGQITVTNADDGKSVHVAYMSLGGMLCRENASFTLSVESVVAFGIGDTWVVKRLSAGTYAANSSLFGRDPAQGKGKAAYMTVFSTEMFAGAVYMGTCTDTNGSGPSDLTLYKWGRIKGEPGVNPACYRLVEIGEGKAEATISLDTAKQGITVSVWVYMTFYVYKYQGDSAVRLTDVSGFNVDGRLYDAEEAVIVKRGNDGTFVLTYHSAVSGDDMDDYATLKVALRDSNNKIWDVATFPVVLNNGSVYTRTAQMMESIYTNKQGLTTATQDAKSIKEMVYSHGRNLLYDAGFRDKTVSMDGTMGQRWYSSSGVNTVAFGDDGTAVISASGNTENKYTGVFWYVPVNALGKYTASVYDVQGGGFDGDTKAYMSICACDANKKEKTALGGMMIGSDTDGQRIVLTSADVPEGTPFLELGIYVIRNGTLKIKCPQLERGEEATDWTLRGVEDGLIKAGVDIERGTVTQYGDRFRWMDAKGKMIAGMDADGNATFNGVVHANGGEFTGKVSASQIEGTDITGGTITGAKISGITGSFEKLQSASNANNNIGFDKDGFFVSGYFRTYNGLSVGQTLSAGEGYLGAAYAGSFSCFERVTMVVSYGQATVYGKAGGAVTYSLRSKTTSNGESYYEIECYDIPAITGQTAQRPASLAGIAIDTIIFRDLGGGSYNYHVMLLNYQKVHVIAANNNRKRISIFRNGSLVGLGGGYYFSIFQVDPSVMTPVPASGLLGRGQMWSAIENNDW